MVRTIQDRTGVQGKSAFPASRKVYVEGSRPDIRVPFREVALTPTAGRLGLEANPPIRLYDTSGPYTDPDVSLDVRHGLPALRRPWILERGDVEEYQGSHPPGSNAEQQALAVPGRGRHRGRPAGGCCLDDPAACC